MTGATGLIGRHVLPLLLDEGHEVHAVARRRSPDSDDDGAIWHELDLLDPQACAEMVEMVSPERLLHLAWYAEHGRFWSSPENVRWVEATLALLRAFVAADGSRVVVAGTCAEYDWNALEGAPDEEGPPRCRESDTPLVPATLYGAAKHAVHLVAEPYLANRGVELAWGRIFFLYGPGEQPGRLVPSVIAPLLKGQETPTSDGGQVRDFMHVHDVGRAFAALLDSDRCGTFNISSGEPVTVRAVIERIAALTGDRELVRWGALSRPAGDPPVLLADVTRLREEVGFRPATTLDAGLESTVAWWRSRLDG